MTTDTKLFMSSKQFLEYWQSHRNLTKKTIEAFPEKELFDFSIGGMRTFAMLACELITIVKPSLKGITQNSNDKFNEEKLLLDTKKDILLRWDEETEVINSYFNQISEERFQETCNLFGQFEFPVYQLILYLIDNEIHHRAQGYVYLRSLDIQPPAFWEDRF